MPSAERREKARLAAIARIEADATLPGQEVDAVPLYVSQRAVEALVTLHAALQAEPMLVYDCLLLLRKVQRTKDGPLTACFQALVGSDADG